MFTPGDGVAVAVSGGADSVCLLHALLELAPRWQLTLSVLHVNHNLRGEASRGDADFVRLAWPARSTSVHAHDLDLSSAPGNLEQSARNARLAFFQRSPGRGLADPDGAGTHTVRSGRNRTLSFFARQRRHRTRRDPPGYRPGHRPSADRNRAGRDPGFFARAQHPMARRCHKRQPGFCTQPDTASTAAPTRPGVEPGHRRNPGPYGRPVAGRGGVLAGRDRPTGRTSPHPPAETPC